MRHLLLLLLALTGSPASALAAEAAPGRPTKPNILLIYTDDHGWADLGAQGVDRDIRTPNADQLAREGVRFARGYVSAPQCVPSRAGVLTGRYQQRFGVEDNNKGPLPLAELTIAERLKPAGYVSGQVGKWHLEVAMEKKPGGGFAARSLATHLPSGQGFDEYWCGAMGQYHASHDLQGHRFPDAPRVVADKRFRVVVQTEAALSFLDRRTAAPGQPWFLYLAWFAPHVPLESPEPWFSRTPAGLPLQRRQALAMIAAMDEGLGRIREKLKAMGAERDTLILFISDNGAPLKEGAWDGSLNLPLVGEKGMLTDGGIRTPFVAAWPGHLPAGQVYDHPVSSLDVAATAVALAGQPRDDALDGVNLIPFLTGQNSAAPHDALFWRWRSQSAVLEFPWKLIHLGRQETYLFDVTRPAGETKNLLTAHPDIVARLDAKLGAWEATLQSPGPAEPHNDEDEKFFAAHVEKTLVRGATPATTEPTARDAGGIQGWQCRNGEISLRDGALVIGPSPAGAKAAPFITHAALDVPGPVTVTLGLRAARGGKSTIAWRTKNQRDFTPENIAAFDWPASGDWQEVKVDLPVAGDLVHLRIAPAWESAGPQVRSIELIGSNEAPRVWIFPKPVADAPAPRQPHADEAKPR